MRFDTNVVRDGHLRPTDEAADDDNNNNTDAEPISIPCCRCSKPTTWDATYGDLCYRCCRADNE